ncbi:hypothetical protein MC885_017077, partial [Smutsia gigantea]
MCVEAFRGPAAASDTFGFLAERRAGPAAGARGRRGGEVTLPGVREAEARSKFRFTSPGDCSDAGGGGVGGCTAQERPTQRRASRRPGLLALAQWPAPSW